MVEEQFRLQKLQIAPFGPMALVQLCRYKNNLLGTWLLIYYNQVLGLDALLVSSAIAIALVLMLFLIHLSVFGPIESVLDGEKASFHYASIILFLFVII